MTNLYQEWLEKQNIKEEERKKRYAAWEKEYDAKKKDDFDRSDEAKERDEAQIDSYVEDAYNNMMTGE
jgi:hypothetical protein